MVLIARQVFPPLLVILSLAPVAIAQGDAKDPAGSAFGLVPVVVVVAIGLCVWLRSPQAGPRVSRRPKALAAIEVVKEYGDLLALDEVSLSITAGELVALVGSNGAGKSTFMRLAAGLLEPTRGTLTIEGEPAGSLHARSRLSYIGDQPALYDDLSLDEHIEYVAKLHGLPGRPGLRRPAARDLRADRSRR